jgi:hypothetical protein
MLSMLAGTLVTTMGKSSHLQHQWGERLLMHTDVLEIAFMTLFDYLLGDPLSQQATGFDHFVGSHIHQQFDALPDLLG